MKMILRRRFMVLLSIFSIAILSTPAPAASTPAGQNPAIAAPGKKAFPYLERLEGKTRNYLAPSQIDSRFNIAIYVNASGRGRNAQRMWVLQRDPGSGEFKLAMWDKRWWKRKRNRKKYKLAKGQTPPFSWLVSTGKKWRGDSKSGPTSLGVFAMDERRGRSQRGWHAPGMIHAMYIDLHYRSGRRSGIAFHGTTRGQYRKLGRIASHGCIRMHQTNALNLLRRMKGWDKVLSEEQRWGEVPRFWKRQKGNNRYGYVRDGSLLHPSAQKTVSLASSGETLTDAEPETSALTKTGFRAIAVIFRD